MRAVALSLLIVLLASHFLVVQAVSSSAEENAEVPGMIENAVWESTALGAGETWLSVAWIPPEGRLPVGTYNRDKTLYPGDMFEVRVQGARSNWYEGTVTCWGAVEYRTFSVEETFDQTVRLSIRSNELAGLREVKFGLFPAKGTVEITTVDEAGFSGTRTVFINGAPVGTGLVIRALDQGSYTVSFEPAPEGARAPPSVTVEITPGRYVKITGRYAFENGSFREGTDMVISEIGSPTPLSPVVAVLVLPVVRYSPRFVIIPYLWTNWQAEEGHRWSYELPFAVLVRYDGNQYDPENENRLSLEQRAVIDGISIVGIASWPVLSMGDQQRYCDNGSPDYHENGDPVMYRDGEALYYDNGMLKRQFAFVTVKPILDDISEVYFGFQELENVREAVYSLSSVYGSQLLRLIRVWGTRMEDKVKTLRGAGAGGIDVDIFKFVNSLGDPFCFDEYCRYWKFVFSIEQDVRSILADWRGTLSLDVIMWSLANGITFEATVEWSSMGLVQPVVVTCWRLAPWARTAAEVDPHVVYMDGAWVSDFSVSFQVRFVPVYSFEEFTSMVRLAIKNTPLQTITEAFGSISENFKPEQYLPFPAGTLTLERCLPYVSSAFYSLLNLDENMLKAIKFDTTWDNSPQMIEGVGVQTGEIGRRGLPLFALEIVARIPPENVRVKSDIINLPFENEPYYIDINLRGEGMGVEVIRDTGELLCLRLHAPARSGGLSSVRVLDSQGNELFARTFPPPSIYKLPWLPKLLMGTVDPYMPQDIVFYKTPTTPTEIRVELTNFWGAKYVKNLTILPFETATGAGPIPWAWIVIAGISLALWAGFVNKLKERKLPQLP